MVLLKIWVSHTNKNLLLVSMICTFCKINIEGLLTTPLTFCEPVDKDISLPEKIFTLKRHEVY